MQIEHKTEKGTLLFQMVSDKHTDFEVCNSDNVLSCYMSPPNSDMGDFIELPNGNWQLIGLTSEVTEEKAKMMVDGTYCSTNGCYLFKNYIENDFDFEFEDMALDSFQSLMSRLEVLDKNPYGEKPAETFNNPDWEYKRATWAKYQSKVGKWIVLFKPND